MQSQQDISIIQKKTDELEQSANKFRDKLEDNSQNTETLLIEAKKIRHDINNTMHFLRGMLATNQDLKDDITNLHTRLVNAELKIGRSITALQLEMLSPELSSSSSRSTNTPHSPDSSTDSNDHATENGLLNEIKIDITYTKKSKTWTYSQDTSLSELYDDMRDSDLHLSYTGAANNYLGFSEEHGKRDYQEDRLAFGSIAKFAELTEEEKSEAINNTIAMLEKNAGMPQKGSTLCMTVVCGDTLYTSHLGDSFSWLVLLDEQEKSTKFMRLNRTIHTGNVISERMRLESEGKLDFLLKNEDYRLYNPESGINLAMTRAIGDREMEKCGLSHDPSHYIDKFIIPEKGAKLIIACDGVIESLNETKPTVRKSKAPSVVKPSAAKPSAAKPSVEELVEKNAKLTPAALAKEITSTALKEGSKDNTSAIVIDLSEWKKTNSSTPIYASVFDGHGGPECADKLRKMFHSTLTTQIELTLAKRETITEEPPTPTSGPHR